MAMDDPWGSPWADEIQTPQPVKLKEDDFAVKPTTPIKAASLALEQNTNSPWDDADDDGFGDWAVGTSEKEKGLGPDGADDGWKKYTGNGLGPDLTAEGSHALSGSWNNDTTIPEDGTPTLRPSLLPKPSDILRQPSPDPWAVDIKQVDELAEALAVAADKHDKGGSNGEPILDLSHEEETAQDGAPMIVENDVLPGTIEIDHGRPTANDTNGIAEESVVVLEPLEVTERNGDIQAAQHISSRPSSSPSDRSHHEDTTQDSPRTSLDEEPKRPSVGRKVSMKVQELVEHFDGLAKQEEVAAPIVSRVGSPDRKTEAVGDVEEEREEEEVDDFGDFEDVQSETEEPMDKGKPDSSPKSPIVEDIQANSPEPVASPEKPKARVVQKDLGPVEFAVDTNALDRLYSSTESKDTPEKAYIPDVVPRDSFSSTEERKTWYRISRYGTMRKYNTGADENYVRVNWTQSQVRAETLKIVARWIEEDRISGRVVLGGASKGSSIFGWNDSQAAPVPLDTAFAIKNGKQKVVPAAEIPREWPKGLVRTRSTSRSPSVSKSRRKSSTKSITTENTQSQLPVANFGWNANPPGVPAPESRSPAHKKTLSGSSSGSPLEASKIIPAPQPTSNRISSPLAEPTKRSLPMNGIPPRPHSIAHTSISVPPSLTTSNVINDDDDWGELVSSPSTNIAPALPSPSIPLHKTTGSLGSAFPPTSPLSQLTGAHSQPLMPEQNIGWASGSNEILSPKRTNPVTAKAPNTLNQNGFTISNNEYMGNAFSPIKQTTPQPVAAVSVDPWATADFSFFDTGAAPVSQPIKTVIPKSMPKSVTFSTPAVTLMPRRNQKSREEIEQDRIVQIVVKGLPDLSYMLRK